MRRVLARAIVSVAWPLVAACGQTGSPGPAAGPPASADTASIHPPAWLQGAWSDGAFVYTFGPSDYTVQGPTEFLSFIHFNRGRSIGEHADATVYQLTTRDRELGWTNQDIFQRSPVGSVRLTSLNSIARGLQQVRELTRR